MSEVPTDPKPEKWVKLLRLYAFPELANSYNQYRYNGIWETIGIEKADEKNPYYLMRLTIVWNGCQPLGTIKKFSRFFIEQFGCVIDRTTFKGTPNPNKDTVQIVGIPIEPQQGFPGYKGGDEIDEFRDHPLPAVETAVLNTILKGTK